MFSSSVLPGGYKYTLAFVDNFSNQMWLHGMHGISGDNMCDALWRFFLEAGRFPRLIQCDLNTGLWHASARCLLNTFGIRLDTHHECYMTMQDFDHMYDESYISDDPAKKKIEWDNHMRQSEETSSVASLTRKMNNEEALDAGEAQNFVECALEALTDKVEKGLIWGVYTAPSKW
jgi:hypothetical protein